MPTCTRRGRVPSNGCGNRKNRDALFAVCRTCTVGGVKGVI